MIHKSHSAPSELVQSETFRTWFRSLRDQHARLRIFGRLARLAAGNAGDVRRVGLGVSELRIHCGPGYRLYFQQRGNRIVLLLCGGDKSTQSTDIKRAIRIAQEWS